MIHVTRLNRAPVVLNSDLIEYVETTPDTVISLTTGEKLMVRESVEEIISRVVDYQKRIHGVDAAHQGPYPPEQTEPATRA